MYAQDSFFTLSTPGRIGLVVLSLGLAMAWIAVVMRLCHGKRRAVRIVVALLAFWFFEWVSPQVYYLYYIGLLGVSSQIVIGWPPDPGEIARLLTFTGPANLSAHGRGGFGLVLLGLALWGPVRRLAI